MNSELISLKQVIDGGFCVGCGACAFTLQTKMDVNRYGEYTPDLNLIDSSRIKETGASIACPALHPELNEDVLAKEIFGQDCVYDPRIGFNIASYAAYAIEGHYRQNGTSGGMTTWIATELLATGLIDGVIHVKQVDRKEKTAPYFKYGISHTAEEIQSNSKTRYHVVELSEVLPEIIASQKCYLFIGVPCMSKAIRRLQRLNPDLKQRIPFVISLVCGHLKSINWSISLSWGANIDPKDSALIQYRTKGPEIPARAYVFRATSKSGVVTQRDSAAVTGGKFNIGALMLPACDYCDDVVGETADVTVGDAWLPRFEADNGGTNLLVVRNPEINNLLSNAANKNRIMLTDITSEEAAQSQSGGFRQRREGLSYRLFKLQQSRTHTPAKRVSAGQYPVSKSRKKVYDIRSLVTSQSREFFAKALEANDYTIYTAAMNPLLKKARLLEIRSSFFRLASNKLNRILYSLLKSKK